MASRKTASIQPRQLFVTEDLLDEVRKKIERYEWARLNFEDRRHRAQRPDRPVRYRRNSKLSVPFTEDFASRLNLAGAAAVTYAVTQERELGERAARRLLDLMPEWPTWRSNTLGLSHYVRTAARIIDLVADCLSVSQVRQLQKSLREDAATILRNDRGDSNWQAAHNVALHAIGVLCQDGDLCDLVIHDERRGLLRHLRCGVREDGYWWEGSPGYHLFTSSSLFALAEQIRNTGHDFSQEEPWGGRLKSCLDAPLRCAFPDLALPGTNDAGVGRSLLQAAPLYEIGCVRYGDGAYGWLVTQTARDSVEALLVGPGEPKCSTPKARSNHLDDMGFIVLRSVEGARHWNSDSTTIVFDHGPYGSWHGHPDCLSLHLHALGEPLLEDKGASPAGYGPRTHWDWYRQTLAHNTVTVDGTSQSFVYGLDDAVSEKGAGGTASLCRERDFQVATANADGIYPGVLYRRVVALLDDYALDLFTVYSSREHVYDYALHGKGALRLDCATEFDPHWHGGHDEGWRSSGPGEIPWTVGIWSKGEWHSTNADPATAYQYLTDVRRAEDVSGLQADFVGGCFGDGSFLPTGVSLRVILLGNAGSEVIAGDGPSAPEGAHTPTLIVRRRACATRFVAALVPFIEADPDAQRTRKLFTPEHEGPGKEKPPSVAALELLREDEESVTLCAKREQGRDLLVLSTGRGTTQCTAEGVDFGGRFCWVHFDAKGEALKVRAIDCTHLIVGSHTHLPRGAKPRNLAVG